MSALPPKADIDRHYLDVCFVPKAAVSRCSKDPVSKPRLFDHLVSGREQRRRNGQTKRFRGLEIEYELELGRLFHWNIAEFGPA